MKVSNLMAFIGIACGGLAACATVPPPRLQPPAVPGFTFGYCITGPVKASVISDATRTWVTLPQGVSLQQAEGDGRYVSIKHDGSYWVISGIANQWRLYTSDGPLWALAPDTVGVLLASKAQSKHDQPVYVKRVSATTVPFEGSKTELDGRAIAALNDFANKLSDSHHIIQVEVSGQTSGKSVPGYDAPIGAARSAAVALWLNQHGIAPVTDLGWTAGGYPGHGQATIAAVYTVKQAHKRETPVGAARTNTDTAFDLYADRKAAAGEPEALSSAPLKSAAPHTKTNASKGPVKTTAPESEKAMAGTHTSSMTATAQPTPHATADVAISPVKTPAPTPEYVFKAEAGRGLLSKQLSDYLQSIHWNLVWTGGTDYVVKYSGTYTGTSLKQLMTALKNDYHLVVHIYQGNHIVAVGNSENK